ncbi:MAG: hypothetical protein RL365_1817 [Bacteroidota bacterium]
MSEIKQNPFSMKKLLLGFISAFALTISIQAQVHVFSKQVFGKEVPTAQVAAPNLVQLQQEDILRDKQGLLYRIGVARTVNLSPQNSGIWTTLANGDRQWKLRVSSEGAEALSFLFQTFKLNGKSTLEIKNNQGVLLHQVLTAKDVEEHFMYNAALCFGDEMVLILTEPAHVTPSELFIDRIMYNYRSTGTGTEEKINESEACEVNVNCSPVGDNWQDEKRGVARIYVVEGNQAGWCTGSLINNLANDCKPLFLTALHCGVNCSASDFNQWKFYFRYESPNCTNPNTAGTLDDYFINGCVKLSDSGDGGGTTGSDFLLVQLGTLANQATTITTLKSANFNAYWNGWDANNTITTGGTGIHHPAGDIKKISTFSGNTVSSTWPWGSTPNTHWRLVWTANTNGHGVTEGGSSGSPIFNNSSGRIIGTLTGGGSYCNATNQPDYYGKMSYHWISNGTTNNRRLKPFLDPANTGALTQNGSSDPCSAGATLCIPSISNACDEYIGGVQLNTLNNTSSCTAGGYADYSNMSTTLAKGTAYSATITPGITGQANPGAYTNDEIAIWIDYNNDMDFNDIGEQVGYVLVATGWSNVFNFTVPMSATTGALNMRVRISYSPDGAIDPCAVATYGETEDYTVILTGPAGIDGLDANLVSIYPNPTENKVTIALGELAKETNQIDVLDITGKTVRQLSHLNGSVAELELSNLAKGIYHVVISMNQGTITKQVIKQ